MNKVNIINKIFDILIEIYPDNDKAKSLSIIDCLIATKLTQHTTDVSAYKAYSNLKKKYKNWNELLQSSIEEIVKEINVCGLAPTKASDIKLMLEQIKKSHGTFSLNHLRKLKNDEIYDDLLQYKGIGKKTISCVLAFALKRDVFPVDTHIHRVLNRIGILKTKSPDETFEQAKAEIPDNKKIKFHTLLIKFGRNICKSHKPKCGICPIFKYCGFKEKYLFKEAVNNSGKPNNFIIFDKI